MSFYAKAFRKKKMGTSAFESSLRRANPSAASAKSSSSIKECHPKKPPPRRSRSVSAVGRSPSDVSAQFSFKRDNPLFWSSNSPPHAHDDDDDEITSKLLSANDKSNDNGRGRSVSRNSNEMPRSSSVADPSRRARSVSRRPVSRGLLANTGSEVEQEFLVSSKYRSIKNLGAASSSEKKGNLGGTHSSLSSQMGRPCVRTGRRKPSSSSDGSPISMYRCRTTSSEDGASTGSISEADEISIKAAFDHTGSGGFYRNLVDNLRAGDTDLCKSTKPEARNGLSDVQNVPKNVIHGSKAASIVTTDISDIPPDLVSPDAVELVLDIRRGYAEKLEESQERARKLRVDLAVEEHRGMELSRILKEVLPDPKTPSTQKSRPRRKASIERRKISKCLTEEAFAYFDECVSLSTFDSSDFSSQEEPALSFIRNAAPHVDGMSVPCLNVGSAAKNSYSYPSEEECGPKYENEALDLKANSSSSKESAEEQACLSSNGIVQDQKFHFSFPSKLHETSGVQQDIRKYVEGFEKVKAGSEILRSNSLDLEEYNLQNSRQGLLFDHVLFKKRIESGSLLLCNGGSTFPFFPFASVI